MATVTSVHVPRRMSTPLQIDLVGSHLPAPVRDALENLQQTRTALAAAEQDFSAATPATWHELNNQVEAARPAAEQALSDFAGISAASSSAIRDSAGAAFATAMENANAAVHTALDALAEAGQAAALSASVKPGKPVLRLDTRAATDSPVRQRLAMVRSNLRELLEQLPDSLD